MVEWDNPQGSTIVLHPVPPYDLALTMRAARFYAVRGRPHEGAYRRVLRVGTELVLVEIHYTGEPEAPHLEARVLTATGDVPTQGLVEQLEHLLNLSLDLRPFYSYAQSDEVLRQTAHQLYGLRTFLTDSVFEALITTIIEQQITLRMAHAAERWLMTWAGKSIEYQGETYYSFPTPERLAQASIDDLKPLKITGQRMLRIHAVATGVADGTLDLEGLRVLPPDEIYAALRQIKGVGHWTAAWTMIKSLGYFANFGSGDVGLRAAVNAYYFGLPGNADHAVVDALLVRYQPFDGIAAFFTLMRWALERYTYIV